MKWFHLPAALLGAFLFFCQLGTASDYTPGVQHNFTHVGGEVAKNTYQYSLWVPGDYRKDRAYPVVVYLHGGGRGRTHPDQGKRNMVSARLVDNQRWTDAGYSSKAQGQFGYLHVAPVKPIARWEPDRFKRMIDHVKTKVSIDENRIYVTGFSMGGQGTWRIGCADEHGVGYRIAAMMPLGAWGCSEVTRGTTALTCRTLKTALWVQHCPRDHVSRIVEQIPLYQNHLDCGGYGRFTMIPGQGHISRPGGDDREGFSMRMAWMLSQTYGTPFNYCVEVDGGVIEEVLKGERPFLGETGRYGFFEPGSVLQVTAAESRDGRPFVKWSSSDGLLEKEGERTTRFSVGKADAQLAAIYEGPVQLKVVGGVASPARPAPGQIVKVALSPRKKAGREVLYWTTDGPLALAQPHAKEINFLMPARDVTIRANWVRDK